MLRKHEPEYMALWAGPCDFDEVLISPVMIQDHMPDNMLKALRKVRLPQNVTNKLNISTSRNSSLKLGHYEPLDNSIDTPELRREGNYECINVENLIDIDSYESTEDQSIDSKDNSNRTSLIVVDVEIHKRNETQISSNSSNSSNSS